MDCFAYSVQETRSNIVKHKPAMLGLMLPLDSMNLDAQKQKNQFTNLQKVQAQCVHILTLFLLIQSWFSCE